MNTKEQNHALDLVSSLLRSHHANLELYLKDALPMASADPAFYAHFVTYNHEKSVIRDSKVALPVIGMYGFFDGVLSESIIAQLCRLGPRELHRAALFHRKSNKHRAVVPGNGALFKTAVTEYLRALEGNHRRWDSVVSRSRDAMTGLYAMFHVKPSDRAADILFNRVYPAGTIFDAIKNLSSMTGIEAAGTIAKFKISPQVVTGAIGKQGLDRNVLLAMIDQMSGGETVNYARFIQKHANGDMVVMAAMDQALDRAAADRRTSVTKMGVAAKAVGGTVARKLESAQEKMFDLRSIGGKWAILTDRSGSMDTAVEAGKQIAAVVAKMVEEAHLVFFNNISVHVDVSGKTLEEINEACRGIYASGGTSIGVGLRALTRKGIQPDAIIIVSDGEENTAPLFMDVYKQDLHGTPDVYYIKIGGAVSAARFSGGIEVFELDGRGMDYYSLPNMIAAVNVDKYALLDEINNARLWTISEALAERA